MQAEADIRKCIVLGETEEKENLLRFTEVDGIIIPDFSKKLPGRGIYISASKSALIKAIEKKLFSKSAKKKLNENIELLEIVEKILKKKGLETINLAKKAGALVTGFEKVREALIKQKVAFILEAKDAGNDGRMKITSLAKSLKVFSLYATEELDKALDRVNTVHVAFINGKMADKVYDDLYKLENFLNS